MQIRLAQPKDWKDLAAMRALLWPDGSYEEHLGELQAGPSAWGPPGLPVAWLVAEQDHGLLIGFLEVSLRSHADGCDIMQPVGYVEGWYVREEYRRMGIGAALMRAAEGWARAQGCIEMASDALIDNPVSEDAHAALGFEIVDRCVRFRKAL